MMCSNPSGLGQKRCPEGHLRCLGVFENAVAFV